MKALLSRALICFFGVWILITPALAAPPKPKIGVLITSYGDIDEAAELKDYVRRTLMDPDVVPLPKQLRWLIANLGYLLMRKQILEEYSAIGGSTHLRRNTRIQAARVAEVLRARGFDAVGYIGFSMTFPFISEALEQARLDGVDNLVVLYQGAQYSQATAYVQFREVETYLGKHSDWQVKVVGVKSFADDTRFVEQLIANIEKTWQQSYAAAAPEDVCIILPLHGQINNWLSLGDPYLDQVMRNVEAVRQHFAESHVSYGFQNHGELPLIEWTQPSLPEAIDQLANQACSKVIASGQISYTIDSLETLYDHAIALPERLVAQAAMLGSQKDFVLVPMFNADWDFVRLIADLVAEAIAGGGDVVQLGVGALALLDLKSRGD